MAMIRVEPVEVHVRTGWFDGSPREITWGDQRLPVTRLAAVREEAAAYPVITGPRTMFEVETARARFALTAEGVSMIAARNALTRSAREQIHFSGACNRGDRGVRDAPLGGHGIEPFPNGIDPTDYPHAELPPDFFLDHTRSRE